MKKQRRYLGIIAFMGLCPFLMAFTREPYSPNTLEYTDIEVVVNESPSPTSEDNKLYEFTVTNTGDGYINKYGQLDYHFASGDTMPIYEPYAKDPVFHTSVMVKKNNSLTIKMDDLSTYDFTTGYFTMAALIEPNTSMRFNGPKTIYTTDESRFYCYIDCEIVGKEPDYSYVYLVTLDYDGTEYCLQCSTDAKGRIYFMPQDMDTFKVDKVTIKDIVGYKYERQPIDERGIDYGAFILGGALYIMLIYGVVFVSIAVFIVLPAIIIPTSIRRSIRKNNKNKTK